MNSATRRFARAVLASLSVVGTTVLCADSSQPVPFPENYRSWPVVRTLVVGPTSPLFARRGGIHHYYANALAMQGYRTGRFPTGSVIVDEAVRAHEGEGRAQGILLEDETRFVEVMRRFDDRYAQTGGWRFQRFEGSERVGRLTDDDQAHCFECHRNAQGHDHVFSRLRTQ